MCNKKKICNFAPGKNDGFGKTRVVTDVPVHQLCVDRLPACGGISNCFVKHQAMKGVNYYLVLIGLVLSSCVGEQKGIFGSLPALYEQGASRQRDLEDLLASGDADDAEAAAAMNDFMNTYTSLEQNIRREGKRLVGQLVKVLTSPASGLKAGAGVISAVTPGAVTIVEIRIPVDKAPKGNKAYVCFLDDDNELVAKAPAWYDAAAKAVRMDVVFAMNPDGQTVADGAFDHYDQTSQLALVSEKEYNFNSYGDSNEVSLVTEPVMETTTDSLLATDSTQLTAATDSLQTEEEPEEKWNGPVLTSHGVEQVRLGASLRALPDRIAGLYDHKRLEKEVDEMEEETMLTAVFYQNGQRVMTALGDEQGNLVFLTVEAPTIKIDVNGHYFGVGDPLQPLYLLKGVVIDESGAFAATYHGISIAPTPTGAIHAISIGAVW